MFASANVRGIFILVVVQKVDTGVDVIADNSSVGSLKKNCEIERLKKFVKSQRQKKIMKSKL